MSTELRKRHKIWRLVTYTNVACDSSGLNRGKRDVKSRKLAGGPVPGEAYEKVMQMKQALKSLSSLSPLSSASAHQSCRQ